MKQSISSRLKLSLKAAAGHNSHVMAAPEVVLWPDPERQWEPILGQLLQELPQLLVFGDYEPEKRKGPAVWLKCMVGRSLPEANWASEDVPIIYMPGISKQHFKEVSKAGLTLQPLIEYQYTGTIWLHENGKEWTVSAFLQNLQQGLGIKLAQDGATRDAIQSSLSGLFKESSALYQRDYIDAQYLLSLAYPDADKHVLTWMERGDSFLSELGTDRKEAFKGICMSRFGSEPDYRNVKEWAANLGMRRGAWEQLWQYYANAPHKYPKVPELLRLARPTDLGTGMFSLPKDSWPQDNEKAEEELRSRFHNITDIDRRDVPHFLMGLLDAHAWRKDSVWQELGQTPMFNVLHLLHDLALACESTSSASDLGKLVGNYAEKGFHADTLMRKALAAVSSAEDLEAVTECVRYIYLPWLETLNTKFQSLYRPTNDLALSSLDGGEFLLFVDALRYEMACELKEIFEEKSMPVELEHGLTAIPTVTPTAKPFNSPIADLVSRSSEIEEFRPRLSNGKDLTTAVFRDALKTKDYKHITKVSEAAAGSCFWMEIGTLDERGHNEQSLMVRRVNELYQEITEIARALRTKGFRKFTIVTDHGWLLMPGGLPKTQIPKDLAETRWGRCALMKEGAQIDLPHFPWTWNPETLIAYAPGISFFKNNEEYAHGGLSLQECVVPRMHIALAESAAYEGRIAQVKWSNLICHIELEQCPDGHLVDVRTKVSDALSSVVLTKPEKRVVTGNRAKVMINDENEGDAAYVVLTDSEGVVIDEQLTSVGKR